MPELLLGLAESLWFATPSTLIKLLAIKLLIMCIGRVKVAAAIMNYFSKKSNSSEEEMGQRQSAVVEMMTSNFGIYRIGNGIRLRCFIFI